jgi:Kef-type K+ transport system membrane component KefB
MPDVSFTGLLIVVVIAAASPLLLGLAPRLRVPSVVVEIVAGIVVGPSGLKWVKIDLPIQILSLIGLAFLLFLSGLEIDLDRLRGRLIKLASLGWLVSIAIAFGGGELLHAVGWTRSPLLVAVALSATSLGLVVPVLKDARESEGQLGQLIIGAASVADFGAILLLSLFFSTSKGTGTGTKLVLIAGLAVAAVLVAVTATRLGRTMRLRSTLLRLQDTTAEIRVRLSVALLIAFVALASKIGVETILGAFVAGVMLGRIDRDGMSHPRFRAKLDAIGYGFLIPAFFITSGLRFDLKALVHSPSAFARIPVFLVLLLVVRGLPAVLYNRTIGRRAAVAAGLLQATSLPLIVTATQIGLILGTISPITAAALVAAGLLSVVIFPPIALALLRTAGGSEQPGAASGHDGSLTGGDVELSEDVAQVGLHSVR